jgi:tRNA (mo5U34)-methyltransferase
MEMPGWWEELMKLRQIVPRWKMMRRVRSPTNVTTQSEATSHARQRNVAKGTAALRADQVDWFHSIDLGNGRVTPGVKSMDELQAEFRGLDLTAEQLMGRTVLDIGCADGWNALRCESLGAEVTAIDGVYRDGLRYVRHALRPRFRFVQLDVLSPSFLELGAFDVVLYLGILYHTPYPYEQLVRVSRACREELYLESAFLNLPGQEHRATLTFNFNGEITSDLSSPVFPSTRWILEALKRIGFRQIDILSGGEGELGRVVVRGRQLDPAAMPLVYAAEQIAT